MTSFPPLIEQRLAELPQEYAESARHLLPTADQLVGQVPYERVLQAILALADGSWRQLAHYAEVARQDWRDVLYWAEGDDGPSGPH